jgi:phosphoglycolate phosphatase-like HAD superfamily hydrolase
LFDIDGTLLAGASGAHRAALHRALALVHQVDASRVPVTVEAAGRTDGEIARAILVAAGVQPKLIDACAADVTHACGRAYVELCDADLSRCVIEGIPELLSELSARADVCLSLLTGNFEEVARLKLTRAGLGGWFPRDQGVFGSDTEDRLQMPPIARRRAGTDGLPFPRERTLVIGDTPRDIACARADQLACVAVTSGPFGAEELADADEVTSGASELREALSRWLDGR